jgi:orotidine-5'-phosphate decarboxylase
LGPAGWDLLAELVAHIRRIDPKVLLIADAKRGDIGNTAAAYARAFFEVLEFDAITVSPYMGRDTIEPFLAYPDRAAIVLCLTSNPGAEDFEMTGDPPLFLRVAREVSALHEQHGNVWMVVGATRAADQVNAVREAAPGVPWLVPGVGAQGGSMSDVIAVTDGDVLINASRSILYAGKTRDEVVAASRNAALELVEEMRRVRR